MINRIIHGSKMDYLDDYGLVPDLFLFFLSLPEHRHKKTGSVRCRLIIKVHRKIKLHQPRLT